MNIKEIFFKLFGGTDATPKTCSIIKNLSCLNNKFTYIKNFNPKDVIVLPDFGEKYVYDFRNGKYQLFYSAGHSKGLVEVKDPPGNKTKKHIGLYTIYVSDSHKIDFEITLNNPELDNNDLNDIKYVLRNLVKLDFQALSNEGNNIDSYNNHEGYLAMICINNDELIFDYVNNYCNASWQAFFRREQSNKWTFSEIG